jgi:hypothetical protein
MKEEDDVRLNYGSPLSSPLLLHHTAGRTLLESLHLLGWFGGCLMVVVVVHYRRWFLQHCCCFRFVPLPSYGDQFRLRDSFRYYSLNLQPLVHHNVPILLLNQSKVLLLFLLEEHFPTVFELVQLSLTILIFQSSSCLDSQALVSLASHVLP